MTPEDRHRIAVMIDIVLRDTTNSGEREAALHGLDTATNGKSIADLVKEICTPPDEEVNPEVPRYTVRERELVRPWLEWKAEHERVVAENARLRRRVAALEGERWTDKYRVKPDADNKVPFWTWLIRLLAVRDWQIRDAYYEFCQLVPQVSQQDINDWRRHKKVNYDFYKMLDSLPFDTRDPGTPRDEPGDPDVFGPQDLVDAARHPENRLHAKFEWDDAVAANTQRLSIAQRLLERTWNRKDQLDWFTSEVNMLKEYYKRTPVPPDTEIAAEMSRRLGRPISGRAVHSKAHKLGWLHDGEGTPIKRAGRRLKSKTPPAAAE